MSCLSYFDMTLYVSRKSRFLPSWANLLNCDCRSGSFEIWGKRPTVAAGISSSPNLLRVLLRFNIVDVNFLLSNVSVIKKSLALESLSDCLFPPSLNSELTLSP